MEIADAAEVDVRSPVGPFVCPRCGTTLRDDPRGFWCAGENVLYVVR
ncbi:hypothetical protein N8K70_04045 [Microbacterium betulae]|uniref:Uncharacterized protein n=1 Tax=Microbacterium betulae TaxID=2981139 RepID=A0AA97FJ19_9MICO|nr:hypothetical protein [Microbacterium sp. AB]WOF23863.1 hypothetical protein N8K70_04045 [Microbacterium sp. AB]